MKKGLALFLASLATIAPPALGQQVVYSLEELISSSLGDPAFKYKLYSCIVFDKFLAKQKSEYEEERTDSAILTNQGIRDFQRAFRASEFYSRNMTEDVKKHLIVMKDQLANQEAFSDNWDMCVRAYDEVILQYEKRNTPVSKQKKSTESNSEAHSICLAAKDYEGCMRHNSANEAEPAKSQVGRESKKSAASNRALDCNAVMNGINTSNAEVVKCIKKMNGNISEGESYTKPSSIDKPDPEIYLSRRDVEVQPGFTYLEYSLRQKKVRGSYGRYITFIGRSVNEYEGTSGTYLQGNSGTVNCYSTGGYGSYTTNCSRDGYVAPSYIGGTDPGVQRRLFRYELDCVDRTFDRKGDIKQGGWKRGWMDVYYDPTARAVADRFCSVIHKLPKR